MLNILMPCIVIGDLLLEFFKVSLRKPDNQNQYAEVRGQEKEHTATAAQYPAPL
jgi:hypothetical protein